MDLLMQPLTLYFPILLISETFCSLEVSGTLIETFPSRSLVHSNASYLNSLTLYPKRGVHSNWRDYGKRKSCQKCRGFCLEKSRIPKYLFLRKGMSPFSCRRRCSDGCFGKRTYKKLHEKKIKPGTTIPKENTQTKVVKAKPGTAIPKENAQTKAVKANQTKKIPTEFKRPITTSNLTEQVKSNWVSIVISWFMWGFNLWQTSHHPSFLPCLLKP